jgi:4-amino-4-deoxy-L-arabinose transferase-like glycosyltransferase
MQKWVFLGVIGLAFLLRVVGLNSLPVGFTPDEASFGYDAYSILKTGKDQWGNTLPISFKSFGDYKLPVYTYLAVPSVAIFGLNEFAVRFPNAILGTLAVIAAYFICKEFSKSFGFRHSNLEFIASFLLAISPWHIMLSRGAFEANLTTFFLPISILFFHKGLKNPKFLIFSSIFFVINLFTYHTARLLTPLIVIFLIAENPVLTKKVSLTKLLSASIFLFFLLMAISDYSSSGGSRVASSSILQLSSNVLVDRFKLVRSGEPVLIAKIFNNKITYIAEIFTKNYLSYFSPQFLFTNGAGEGTYGMIPGVGLLYSFEIIFLITFIWFLFTGNFKKLRVLIFWILISPIPASLSVGPGFAANRVAFMIPAIQIVSAIGAAHLLEKLRRRIDIKIAYTAFGIVFFISFLFFLQNYMFKEPANGSLAMKYGVSQIMNYLSQNQYRYQKIIISKKISEPQIYLAFYLKLDPNFFQQSSQNWQFQSKGLTWVDQLDEYSLGDFVFKDLNYKFESMNKNALIVGESSELPDNIKTIYAVNYPDKSPAYKLVETQ